MDHSMMDHGALHGMGDMAVSAGFDYTLAFVAGFLGSGHCLGMCGALVSGYFMNSGRQRSYLPYVMYQMSRLSVYTVFGFAAALLGVVMMSGGFFGKMQSLLQMLIGVIVIGLGLGIMGWLPWQGALRLLPISLLRIGYARSRQQGAVGGAMLAGLLNGMMPCPLTFAMAVKATSASTVLEGGALMLTFGAGTLPMMLFISLAFGKIKAHIRGIMYKAAALIMIFMGLNTFYRGFGFYVEENFRHHNYFSFMKERIDSLILYLNQVISYFGDLISHIQNM